MRIWSGLRGRGKGGQEQKNPPHQATGFALVEPGGSEPLTPKTAVFTVPTVPSLCQGHVKVAHEGIGQAITTDFIDAITATGDAAAGVNNE